MSAGELFSQEIATYRRELARLLGEGKAGQFALIRGDQVLGVWKDYPEALQAGLDRFGLEPICVKKVDPRDVERFILLDSY